MRKYLLGAVGLMLVGCASPATTTNHLQQSMVAGSDDIIPGQILVDLKDNVSDSDIKDLEKKTGLSFSEANSVAHEYRFEEATVDPANEDAVLEQLKGDSRVEHAEPMIMAHAYFTPNDPMYKDQWGLTRIGTESSWGMNCGIGAKVAIIDTGVQCSGEDRIKDLAQCNGGFDFVKNSEGGGIDPNSHGSHCASSVAELTNNSLGGGGIAPCATIVPVRVLNAQGSGTMEAVAEGIRWAADNADVLSLSLGSSQPSGVVKDAVDYAYSKGKVVIAANGNSSGPIGYPAAYDHVMAVSAIDKDDSIAGFSSRGPQTAIAAPGVGILQSTWVNGKETYVAYSGTSMSTPHVSGVAALLVSQGITNPDAIREKLQSTADPKDNKNNFGAGILRADSAVRSTIFNHTMFRIFALMGILFILRKAIKDQWKNKLTILGTVVGGFGVVPLFFTGLLPRMGALRIVGELVSRPIGEMDIVFGHGHQLLLLASAIPTAIATVLMLGHNKLKYLAGGLGIGSMALEAQIAYSNDTNFVFGSVAMRIFMLVNMVIAGYFVRAIFTHKPAQL